MEAMSGGLERWSSEQQEWLRRWFVLDTAHSSLLWYSSPQKAQAANTRTAKGRLSLTRETVVSLEEGGNTLSLCVGPGFPRLLLRGQALREWSSALEKVCRQSPAQKLKPQFQTSDNSRQEVWEAFEDALSQSSLSAKFKKIARRGCPHELRPSYWMLLAPFVFDNEGKHRKKTRRTTSSSTTSPVPAPAPAVVENMEGKANKQRGSSVEGKTNKQRGSMLLPQALSTSSFSLLLSVTPRKRSGTRRRNQSELLQSRFLEMATAYAETLSCVPPYDVNSDHSEDDEDDTWPAMDASSSFSPPVLRLNSRTPAPDVIKLVHSDISRTYSNQPYFRAFEGQLALRRVLLAFAVQNPDIGYCQSLNFLAGVLLLIFPESMAFAFLQLIICEILPPDYFSSTMIGVQTDVRVFLDLVQKKYPRVSAHCHKLGVDLGVVAVSWFLCLFTKTLPLETCLLVWDNLLLEGNKVLFRFGLALISLHSKHILKIQDMGDMFDYLNAMGAECGNGENVERLLQAAFYEQGTLRRSDIEAARIVRRQELQLELENRTKRELTGTGDAKRASE